MKVGPGARSFLYPEWLEATLCRQSTFQKAAIGVVTHPHQESGEGKADHGDALQVPDGDQIAATEHLERRGLKNFAHHQQIAW